MSGVMVMALVPADEAGFAEADWLADGLAFALADDDALVLGVADSVADGEDAAACVCAGLGLGQVWFGVGAIVFCPVAVAVGLGLWETVGVGVPLGLTLGLTVALGLLVLALAEALALVVLPSLGLPLDDVAGAVAFPVGLLAEPVPVSVADGCVDGDGQEVGVV